MRIVCKKLVAAIAVFSLLPGCGGPWIHCYLPEGAKPVPITQILDEAPVELPKTPIMYDKDNIDEIINVDFPTEDKEFIFLSSLHFMFASGVYSVKSNKIYLHKNVPNQDYLLTHELVHATGPILGRAHWLLPENTTEQVKISSVVREEVVAELGTYILFAEGGNEPPGGNWYIRQNLAVADPGPIEDLYPQAQQAATYILGRKPRARCKIKEDIFKGAYLRWPIFNWLYNVWEGYLL
jgi:hypothetical protein